MSVTKYEIRFIELSRHAIALIPTDEERVNRFIEGLHYSIRRAMDRKTKTWILLHQVVEIARRVERIHSEAREIIQGRDKRSRYSGSFSDASFGGQGRFKRGHSSRPVYHSPTLNRGGSVHSSFGALPTQSSHHAPSVQISPIMGSCNGYSGSRGLTQDPQSFLVKDASVLFDPVSTYSYVSSYFVSCLDIPRGSLDAHVHESTPTDDSIVVDRVYRSCVVTICCFEMREDFLLLDMMDFDVIFGMEWLFPYHVILDYHTKTMTLAMPGSPRLGWKGSLGFTSSRVISFLKA
ncbi:uncharacterized protein [Nicotiana tomentosiformis]|uniref:uncharacterized protein n=1 Tax=Nicotiana tomentosiformis TaxID=4098 RepID=UPI00388C3737